jgi:MarR family
MNGLRSSAQEVREVVDMVRRLLDEGREHVRQADLKSVLQLDKSAVSRRVAEAVDAGFLRNLEDRSSGT